MTLRAQAASFELAPTAQELTEEASPSPSPWDYSEAEAFDSSLMGPEDVGYGGEIYDESLVEGEVLQGAGYFAFSEPSLLGRVAMTPEPISALHFDRAEELLWTGTREGRIVGYAAPTMDKYASWHAHADYAHAPRGPSSAPPLPVLSILTGSEVVLSLASNALRCSTRGGLVRFTTSEKEMSELTCMSFAEPVERSDSKLIIGSLKEAMFMYDLERRSVVKEVQMPSGVLSMARGHHYIAAGTASGSLQLVDLRSHRLAHAFAAHSGAVKEVACKGDLVVTAGLAQRMGQTTTDSILKVYDVRIMRALPVLNYREGAAFLRFHPKFTSALLVASAQGRYQLRDTTSGAITESGQVETTAGLGACDISASGDVMAFGDLNGYIHVYSPSDDFRVNVYSQGEAQLMPLTPPLPRFPMTLDSPLTTAAMALQLAPSEGEPKDLLSTWTGSVYFSMPRPPEPLPAWLFSARTIAKDFMHVVQTAPGEHMRNLARHPLPDQGDEAGRDALARSSGALVDLDAQPALMAKTKGEAKVTATLPNSTDANIVAGKPRRPPKAYRYRSSAASQLEGAFDYARYNRSSHAGLENALTNSYLNAILQVLYFVPALRKHCVSTLFEEEFALTCELGFLFRLLDAAPPPRVVEPRNFLRALALLPGAQQLDLLEESTSLSSYAHMIEKAWAFLVAQLRKEAETLVPVSYNPSSPAPPKADPQCLNDLFCAQSRTENVCQVCGSSTVIEAQPSYLALTFPRSPASFAAVLAKALASQQRTTAWCDACSAFQSAEQRKSVTHFPEVLALHCARPTLSASDPDSVAPQEFWTKVGDKGAALWDSDGAQPTSETSTSSTGEGAHWVPFVIQISSAEATKSPAAATKAKVRVHEYSNEKGLSHAPGTEAYQLSAVIASVRDTRDNSEHLVAHILVGSEYSSRAGSPTSAGWHVFNDFTVVPVSKFEAVHIDIAWKSPVILFYSKIHTPTPPMTSPPSTTSTHTTPTPGDVGSNPIGDGVFAMDNPLHRVSDVPKRAPTFTPLSPEELPGKGAIVALDAEFVRVASEESVQTPGGRRLVVKPVQFSLGRVSVLRGWGKEEPFIDDYISTPEAQIQDYLTQYSGLHHGDLDRTRSPHHVTTLKHAYLKLRRLVDRGCLLVGHGLSKDFRMINIVVPPSQIADTVELFYLDGQRRVALRFLAALLLDSDIQRLTHDSIEDARTALALYRKYLSSKATMGSHNSGVLPIVKLIYGVGRKVNWVVEQLTPQIKSEFQSDLEALLQGKSSSAQVAVAPSTSTSASASASTGPREEAVAPQKLRFDEVATEKAAESAPKKDSQ